MYIVVDIGGTNTRVGFSRDGRTFLSVERFPTPPSAYEGLRRIVAVVGEVLRGGRCVGAYPRPKKMVVAIPGTVDSQGRLGTLANLPGWSGADPAGHLRAALGGPVHLVNDAGAAALGEAVHGAGAGARIVAYLTVSTGIGGARVLDGALDQTALGSEPGHHILVPGGRRCGCGQRGCFEAYASGMAFARTFGIPAEQCKDRRIWERYAGILAGGVHNVMVLWSPEVVVIGGGVAQAGNRLFVPLRRAIRAGAFFTPPLIRRSALGDNAGLYGGLVLARHSRVKKGR